MKPITGAARVAAAAVALSVTLTIVWGMATVGYPASSSATLSVCRGS